MNWIDRVVGFVSPEAGFRRTRARAGIEMFYPHCTSVGLFFGNFDFFL